MSVRRKCGCVDEVSFPLNSVAAWEERRKVLQVTTCGKCNLARIRERVKENKDNNYHPNLDGPAEPVGLSMRDEEYL